MKSEMLSSPKLKRRNPLFPLRLAAIYQLIDPVKHSRAAVCCRLLRYCGTDNARCMDENRIYTTVQGDMWDSIAYHFYGDVKYIGLRQRPPIAYLTIIPIMEGRLRARLHRRPATNHCSRRRQSTQSQAESWMKSEMLFSPKLKRRNPLFQTD